jgi:hypothetical protein
MYQNAAASRFLMNSASLPSLFWKGLRYTSKDSSVPLIPLLLIRINTLPNAYLTFLHLLIIIKAQIDSGQFPGLASEGREADPSES